MLLLWLHLLTVLPWNIAAQSSITIPLNNSQIVNNAVTLGGIQHYFFDSTANHPQIVSIPTTTTTTATIHTSTAASATKTVSASSLQPHARAILPRAGSIAAVYLTVTVCSQPQPPTSYQGLVPPLQVFVSTTSSNSLPGPSVPGTSPINNSYPGYTSWNSTSSPTNQLWVGVSAPALAAGWSGNWTYQLGVSTTGPMHQLLLTDQSDDSIPYMTLDDTDNNNALFLTSSYQGSQAPNFTVMISSAVTQELSFSACAAQKLIQNHPVNYTTTTRGPFTANRQQAFVSGLSPATKYFAYFVQPRPNNLPSAYGPPISFNTKSDCYNDYKNWMCSVLIPRCTADSSFNQADAVPGPSKALREVPFNQSRNPWIDSTYSPNQWTELLPCIDLCYRVVQSCPPFMQFNCPSGDIALSQYGYWQTGPADQNGTNVVFDVNNPTCNRMGLNTSLLVLSGSSAAAIPSLLIFLTVLVTIGLTTSF
ncbi:Centractin [Umbelopsis nana]